MSVKKTNNPLNTLLTDLSDKLNAYLKGSYMTELANGVGLPSRSSYLTKLIEKTGLSQPIITAIKNKKVKRISLTTLFKVAAAIGYKVEIKLEKK